MADPTIKYADLNLAEGEGDGVGDSADGSSANPWDFKKAIETNPGNSICFVKQTDDDSAYDATGIPYAIANTNTLGINSQNTFAMYKNEPNTTGLGNEFAQLWVTDMDPGGEFYGGAIDLHREHQSLSLGNPNAVWGHIDGGALGEDIITNAGKHNVVFRGFKFRNVSATTNFLVSASLSPENMSFFNCEFDFCKLYFGVGIFIAPMFFDCFFGPNAVNLPIQADMQFGFFNGCIMKVPNTFIGMSLRNGMSLKNCAFNGGASAFQTGPNPGSFTNCTFNKQTSHCVIGSAAAGAIIDYNNIFYPMTNNSAVFLDANKGQAKYSDYSLYWAFDGNQTSIPWLDATDGDNRSFAGAHVITDQPITFSQRDLRTNVAIPGKPDMNGMPTQMGANLQRAGVRPWFLERRQRHSVAI